MTNLFLTVLNLSITASWIILAVILVRFLFKKAPRWIICLLWTLVAVRLVCPFSIESPLSLIPEREEITAEAVENLDEAFDASPAPTADENIAVTPEQNAPVPDNNDAPTESPITPPTVESPIMENSPLAEDSPIVEDSPSDAVAAPAPADAAEPTVGILDIISILWLAGAVSMLIYCAVSYIRVRRRVADSVPLYDNVRMSERIVSPFILGIIRPRIYLPQNVTGETAEYVVAHERSHLERFDHIVKLLSFLILSVYWFNPLVWVAYVLLCNDIELACDERVIRKMDDDGRRSYAAALLECGAERKLLAACPIAFGEVGVKKRIKNALNYKKPMLWVIVAVVVVTCVIAVCFLTVPGSAEEGSTGETETETQTETDTRTETETSTETIIETETETETEAITEIETETETETETDIATETQPAETDVVPTQPIVTADNINIVVKKKESYSYIGLENAQIPLKVSNTSEGSTVYQIESADDVELFLSFTQHYDNVSVLAPLLSEYGESYFGQNSLILVVTDDGYASNLTEYSDFSFDGKTFNGKITTYQHKGENLGILCIGATRVCVIEINGILPDYTKFNFVREEKTIYIPSEDETEELPQKLITGASDFKYKMHFWHDAGDDSYNHKTMEVYTEYLPDDRSFSGVYIIRVETYDKALELLSVNKRLGWILGDYNKDYFKTKSLMFIFTPEGSGSIKQTFSDFAFDGKVLSYSHDTYTPYVLTEDMNTSLCLLEIDGRLPEDIEYKANRTFSFDPYYTPQQDLVKEGSIDFSHHIANIPNSSEAELDWYYDVETSGESRLFYVDTPAQLSSLCYIFELAYETVLPTFTELKNTYDLEFFKDHSLVFVFTNSKQKLESAQISEIVYKDGTLTCTVTAKTDEDQTEQIMSPLLWAEIEGRVRFRDAGGTEFVLEVEN